MAARAALAAIVAAGGAACQKAPNHREFQTGGAIPSPGDAVDLGTGALWSPWNVGASAPGDTGVYFAWGETHPKADYRWATYAWGDYEKGEGVTKYNQEDRKLRLAGQDDAATANWGPQWRTPTPEEWQALVDGCDWTWKSEATWDGNAVAGFIVRSRKDSSICIFLPASYQRDDKGDDATLLVGHIGMYWSSDCDAPTMEGVGRLWFDEYAVACSAYQDSRLVSGSIDKCWGLTVRPVLASPRK